MFHFYPKNNLVEEDVNLRSCSNSESMNELSMFTSLTLLPRNSNKEVLFNKKNPMNIEIFIPLKLRVTI